MSAWLLLHPHWLLSVVLISGGNDDSLIVLCVFLKLTHTDLWHSSTTVIKKLPPSFARLKKYVESFEHLLMLEIQAQVSGSVAEGATMSSVSCSIVSVLRRDEFWEVTAAVSSSTSVQVCRF